MSKRMNTPLQTSTASMFRASRMHGDPHPGNSQTDMPKGFYFCIDSRDPVKLGHLAGYLPQDEFDWLAERIGVPKLNEVKP